MTAHHRDPLYMRNARIIRKQVNAEHNAGRSVTCHKCGREIQPGQRYDVGHRIDASRGGTHDLTNLGPEHRRENRAAGGRLGALITNTTSRTSRGLPTW
ncbi:hypothetical protein MRBLWH7_000793 [Microbacterium sp. LWH7-1.2]|uniref:hypothetical protein n=1 Tax=Microbacterium sp. LWH7-1.2 TaxID=3135257 RepID=UPI00313A316E